jgi:hypothetical protein
MLKILKRKCYSCGGVKTKRFIYLANEGMPMRTIDDKINDLPIQEEELFRLLKDEAGVFASQFYEGNQPDNGTTYDPAYYNLKNPGIGQMRNENLKRVILESLYSRSYLNTIKSWDDENFLAVVYAQLVHNWDQIQKTEIGRKVTGFFKKKVEIEYQETKIPRTEKIKLKDVLESTSNGADTANFVGFGAYTTRAERGVRCFQIGVVTTERLANAMVEYIQREGKNAPRKLFKALFPPEKYPNTNKQLIDTMPEPEEIYACSAEDLKNVCHLRDLHQSESRGQYFKYGHMLNRADYIRAGIKPLQ